jgi:dsDNA-specific endonuclease/ATPase MutS2
MTDEAIENITKQLKEIDIQQRRIDRRKDILHRLLEEELKKKKEEDNHQSDISGVKIEVGDEVEFITSGKSKLKSGIVTRVSDTTTTVINKKYSNPVGWRRNFNVRVIRKAKDF